MDGYCSDLRKLRQHIDRQCAQLERDHDAYKAVQHAAKIAAAEKAALLKENKGVSSDSSTPEQAPSPAKSKSMENATPDPMSNSLSKTINKLKQQYVLTSRKYFYIFDILRIIESSGTELLLYKLKTTTNTKNVNLHTCFNWLPKKLNFVSVDVHACHEYIPPVIDEFESSDAISHVCLVCYIHVLLMFYLVFDASRWMSVVHAIHHMRMNEVVVPKVQVTL